MTRATLPALGYVYVALALPALILGPQHERAASTLLTGALFAFLWFLGSLRSKLMRFDPDGFFAAVVIVGGSAFAALQTVAVLFGSTEIAGVASACSATVIIGSSLAAWRARKIAKWFGQAGVAGGIAVLVVGLVEAAADWTLAGQAIYASSLGFLVWVLVTATYLLRR